MNPPPMLIDGQPGCQTTGYIAAEATNCFFSNACVSEVNVYYSTAGHTCPVTSRQYVA